jgi:osmotically-inducible protein OsmY
MIRAGGTDTYRRDMTHERLTRQDGVELTGDPRIDGDAIAVSTVHAVVTQRGTVGSRAERDAAVTAAWSVPDVTNVISRIVVFV